MRSTILLLAATSGVSANWLRWSGDKDPVWVPQATAYVAEEDQVIGFTPKPTPAPGVQSDGDRVLDLLRRQTATASWENPSTCGWTSGTSSGPYTCASSSSCATNDNNVVACVSGTYSPFFAVCFDYVAYQGGQCNSIGSLTGCCQQSQYGACGTYIWTGSPARSMYRCFSATTIISMLDEPQFVIDAALSSKTASPTTSPDASTSTSNSGGGGSGGGSSSSNTGAIVGGAVGGVAALALIAGLIAFFIIRNRKSREKQSYNAVPPNEHNAPPHPSEDPLYPATSGQHDPRQSYMQPHDPNAQYGQYDPSKHGHYPASDMHPGAPGYRQSVAVSELYCALPAGHESNPVEMASSPQGH